MNEFDILKSIAENLSERKSAAALNNYEVLCNNIKYLNYLFCNEHLRIKNVQFEIESAYEKDQYVKINFRNDTKYHFYFRKIIPKILLNDITLIDKFLIHTKPDDRTNITVDNVNELSKSFIDYNNLVTTARQFIDSLVSNAYQLVLLDPKVTNYQVLLSLNSFDKFATKSIRQGLFNSEIETALLEFQGLNFRQWKNSHITKCDHSTFANKVDFLFSTLGITCEDNFKDKVKNLFKFSSEFTHIGYISTLFTDSNHSEVIFSDDVSPYLPSTENFNELKYEILETALNFYRLVYLPSVNKMLEESLVHDIFKTIEESINHSILSINNGLHTRNNEYYFFIKEGLIKSEKIIDLTCMCNEINHWAPPHDLMKIYCKRCGSQFNLLEIKGDPGYIITSNGPIRVIGSSVPAFESLSLEEQSKLLKQCDDAVLQEKNKNL